MGGAGQEVGGNLNNQVYHKFPLHFAAVRKDNPLSHQCHHRKRHCQPHANKFIQNNQLVRLLPQHLT